MLHRFTASLIAVLLLSISASAQQDDPACLMDGSAEAPPRTIQKSSHPFCSFTESYINSGCLTTYIRVNLHFFVDSDCTGTTAAAAANNQLQQQLAFQRADDYIATTNDFLAEMSGNPQWNQAEWEATVTPGQCVMLRLVLNDVYIHCESRNRTVRDGNDNFSYYGQDFGEAFNIFIANVSGSVNGFALNLGSTTLVNENFNAQLLIHELGHGLRLLHTHQGSQQVNDGCDDTPFISWTYDQNGDGSIDAMGNRCWNRSNVVNGVDLCEPNGTTVVNSHPCCEERNQNNNVMTYASYASDPNVSAFTPCQMGIMLDDLLNDKCDLIDEINPGCPPASAHIGILPIVDFSDDCKYTLYFQASTNEEEYRITYEVQQPNGSFTTFRQTDWIDGQAGQDRVAVGTTEHDKFANIVLLSNATYNVIIETRNLCGDTDLYARQFTTGNCDRRPNEGGGIINLVEPESVLVYPNPSINGTTLSYTTNAEADIKIYLTTTSGNGNAVQTLLKQADSGNKEAGTYSVYFPTHELGEGLNYISIHADDNIVVRRVQKNN